MTETRLREFKPKRHTNSNLFLFNDSNETWIIKNYLGANAKKRKETERESLSYWKKYGFNVPNFSDMEIPELSPPYLAIQFLSGQTILELLENPNCSIEKKIYFLNEILLQMAKRHRLVLKNNDRLLLHKDLNLDNMIWHQEELYFIDFEHDGKKLPIEKSVAEEVSTLCRRLLDVENSYSEEVALLVAKVYEDQPSILSLLVGFNLWKKFRNLIKKIKEPNMFNRYEFAVLLHKAIRKNAFKQDSI